MTLVIIGGGIAGLSTALELRPSKDAVVVLEREAAAFSLSSARNAAIFRPVEEQPSLVELALRSKALLEKLGPGLLRANGLCLVAKAEASLAALQRTAAAVGLAHEIWGRAEFERRAPWLVGGQAEVGLFLPDAGIVDLRGLAERLSQKLGERGVELRTNAEVVELVLDNGSVRGVRLASGEVIAAERVVNAAGAWAGALSGGFAPPLASHRRHLVELQPAFPVDPDHPVCWNVETEIYFRPHGHLVLACPGDDSWHEPRLPEVDTQVVEGLLGALGKESPALAGATVVKAWACLRTRCRDGLMALGPDPTTPGLHWIAGLGGHGLTVGLAAGQLLAHLLDGGTDPLAQVFEASRFHETTSSPPKMANP